MTDRTECDATTEADAPLTEETQETEAVGPLTEEAEETDEADASFASTADCSQKKKSRSPEVAKMREDPKFCDKLRDYVIVDGEPLNKSVSKKSLYTFISIEYPSLRQNFDSYWNELRDRANNLPKVVYLIF